MENKLKRKRLCLNHRTTKVKKESGRNTIVKLSYNMHFNLIFIGVTTALRFSPFRNAPKFLRDSRTEETSIQAFG